MQGSWMGFGLGLLTGASAALLIASQRGTQTRSQLRARVARHRPGSASVDRHTASRSSSPSERPSGLTATLGEISQLHSGAVPAQRKAWS